MDRRSLAIPLALSALTLSGCFNSDESSGNSDPFSSATVMRIVEVTNGFGRMLPHTVHEVDPITGAVSPDQLVEIRTMDDLLNNRPSASNPILPPARWPATPTIPSGANGNHFVVTKFSRSLNIETVLDPTAGGLSNNGLTGAIQVVAYDPLTGFAEQVTGRGFVNGWSYYGNFAGGPAFERWVAANGPDAVSVLDVTRNDETVQPGNGYPGTDIGVLPGGFQDAGEFISPNTFVFVVDSDDDLSTFETFPADRVIRVVIDDSVLSLDDRQLEDSGLATSGVGQDFQAPLPLLDGVAGNVVTQPVNLEINVPCDQEVHFLFSESCQPYSIGPLPSNVPPSLSNEFTVEFTPGVPPGFDPPGQTVKLPYTILPTSPFNLTEYVVTPAVPFPGSDPNGSSATAFVTYFRNAASDLYNNNNPNSQDEDTISFTVSGECPGLVNAPVAPGAIVIASNGGGTTGGLRVLDLDGFGQGTGDPSHNFIDPFYDVLDVSKFPFNPNLTSPQGTFMFPPLSHDDTTLAGGSAGVFTLTKDSSLDTQLVTSATVGTVGDMMLGHPLDLLYNNWDCLSGGKNLCAGSAFQFHPLNAAVYPGNSISYAPHPNPPRIRLSPSCFAPLIMTEEPTFGQANGGTATNLLLPGNAFGNFGANGPTGLLTSAASYTGFYGPSPTAQTCPQFTLRQQVGHLLYVLDTSGDRVVVLNSNRMQVIDTISVADPRDLAMAPDLNMLAVSNFGTNTVTFIDTDPASVSFHSIIKTTAIVDVLNNRVGLSPGELVWQPDDEDILVVCENSDSMAIISSGSLEVRKIIPGVSRPRFITATNRDLNYGFSTGLYYAYIIAEDGATSIFESGPDGTQGIGFDTFIGIPALIGQSGFPSPMVIQPNPNSLRHSAYIAYRKDGIGSVCDLFLKDAPTGPRPIALNGILPDPNFRAKAFTINREFTGVLSSASIADLALDDLTNIGGMTSVTSGYTNVKTMPHSAKGLMRGPIPVSAPQFLFVANANGKLDIIELNTGQPYVPAVAVPGLQVLCHFWRQ